jgi:hypothetical protein
MTASSPSKAARMVRRSGPPPGTSEAKQRAAAILEVLAGTRTPAEAAAALNSSLPRYYLLEQRALQGLVSACEPRPKGRVADDARRMAELQRSVSRWERECLRQQALARALQRAVGLSAPMPGKSPGKSSGKASGASPGKKARCRKPVARALKAAAALRTNSSSPATAETVQPGPEHAPAGMSGAERDRSPGKQGPSREDHGHGPGRKEAVSP